MSQSSEPSGGADRELVITRVLQAPRDVVFRAWTQEEALAQWWGPKGFDIVCHRLELRPGGMFLYSMTPPNGEAIWGKFVFHEIAPPDRLVFSVSFSDETGGTTRNPWQHDWPLEVHNTLALDEADGQTTMTLRGRPIHATAPEEANFTGAQKSMQQGWQGTLEKLDDYLASL